MTEFTTIWSLLALLMTTRKEVAPALSRTAMTSLAETLTNGFVPAVTASMVALDPVVWMFAGPFRPPPNGSPLAPSSRQYVMAVASRS